MAEYFNANIIRDITISARKELENKEFQNICDKINEAAKQGKFFLKINLEFKTTIHQLKDLGFNVKEYYPECISVYQTGKYYEVSWNGNN